MGDAKCKGSDVSSQGADQKLGTMGLFAILAAKVRFQRSGDWDVELKPEKPLPLQLNALCLCYAAKIRWLLNTESGEIRVGFLGLLEETIAEWPREAERSLVSNLRRARPSFEALRAGYAPRETTFTVKLRHGSNGWSVTNNLPRGAPIGGLLWAFTLLLDAALVRQDVEERERLRRALVGLVGSMREPEADGNSLQVLQWLFATANWCIAEGYGAG